MNGQFFLNDRTAHDDGAVDTLIGGSGMDWFLANVVPDGGAIVKDVLTDLLAGEIATDID